MKQLPNSIHAEKSVIGAMLGSKHAIDEACALLEKADFYDNKHQIIYSVISELEKQRKPVDITTVTSLLEDKQQLEKVGGVEYLVSLLEELPTFANTNHYIKIVEEKALLRRIISVSETSIEKTLQPEVDVAGLINEVERSVLQVTRQRKNDDFEKSFDIINRITERIQFLSTQTSSITGITSGYKAIDKLTNGFQKGDLIIVAARPSMGKTAFALNVAQKAAEISQKPVAIFSLEMPSEQLVQRMISDVGQIPGDKIRSGKFLEQDWVKFNSAAQRLIDTPIYIDDTPAIRVTEIASKCRKLQSDHGSIGMVLIDYLQLITLSAKSSDNRQQEVSEISRFLKAMARELECPVIALSQLSRGVEQRADKRPMMSDLRESGAIEQDADLITFLYREEYYDNTSTDNFSETELIVAKHRNGATGTIMLTFDKQHNSFFNHIQDQ